MFDDLPPCVNCICVPICKAKLGNEVYCYTSILKHLKVINLKNNCSLLAEYINIDDNKLSEIRIKEIYSYLNYGKIDVTARWMKLQPTTGTM